MTPDRTSITVVNAPPARDKGLVPETPARRPLQGVAAAQVVDRSGCARVMPVIVVDFYREAGQK